MDRTTSADSTRERESRPVFAALVLALALCALAGRAVPWQFVVVLVCCHYFVWFARHAWPAFVRGLAMGPGNARGGGLKSLERNDP